ncbi:CotO family spore coat protein [Bacillus sp. X1(2014)]|uniref:CotO family spore coat protein n=1 Tax=Bacillus sp. X1(2014) TaxID=1565991 RepID=UPI001642FA06|nr:CotO family spore coat protein [Bacillus sp. X1(2014)]
MSEEKRKGPLLYIHQPFVRTTATNMQDTYSIRQDLVIEEEKLSEEEGKKIISLAKNELGPEQIIKDETKLDKPSITQKSNSPATPTSKSFQKRKHASLNRVKPFKEMNIEERLDYLKNYPRVLPPAPCVFVTEENNYQGYLTEYDGQDVTIRFHDQTTKTVPVHALTNIILIGLRK